MLRLLLQLHLSLTGHIDCACDSTYTWLYYDYFPSLGFSSYNNNKRICFLWGFLRQIHIVDIVSPFRFMATEKSLTF